jgi:hypothetical protein
MPQTHVEDVSATDQPPGAADLLAARRPLVLRGLAAHWPAVRAPDAADYLLGFDSGAPMSVAIGPPEIEGRLFYRGDDLSKLNFERVSAPFAEIVSRLRAAAGSAAPPAIAAQAVGVDQAFPGFAEANRLDMLDPAIPPRIWIGNRIRVATHHDMSSNVAVAMAGRRRFTLFPPDQAANLYIGPFEFTPAGTPVSLFDLDAPDLTRFPRAAEAMEHALVAELKPGDALYIPHMWWHHVRSLDPVSILVNYWWDAAPAPQPGLAPIDVMAHALLAFSGLSDEQRAAWRAMFDYFVFDGESAAHMAQKDRGIRGDLGPEVKSRLRKQLGQMMAR